MAIKCLKTTKIIPLKEAYLKAVKDDMSDKEVRDLSTKLVVDYFNTLDKEMSELKKGLGNTKIQPKSVTYEAKSLEELNPLVAQEVVTEKRTVTRNKKKPRISAIVPGNQVVYLGDYSGAELKGNEVLAPSKVKLNGTLIDLFESDKSGYKYIIENADGSFQINEDKIDPTLFENFGFRTPTSSHGSGSFIKIVGFIPAIMGDLMITPKNFVTQMGQDFDIDKLTAYQYHHALNSEGKIVKLNESFKENSLESLKKDLVELSKQGSIAGNTGIAVAFLDKAITEAKYGLTEQELTDIILSEDAEVEAKIKKASNAFDMKMAQNKFIEIHNIVYNNQSPEIQRRINKVLSMDVATSQAEGIEAATTSGNSAINILSPNYQMNKLISGSTGSTAIGIYAKGVTFNSLVQQSKTSLGLIALNDKGEDIAKEIRIGNITSDGTFGRSKTISRKNASEVELFLARTTTEVMDEKVNTATDNEKAQILGRVGITHIDSVAVDNLLSLLGVDLEIKTILESEYNVENKFHKKAIVDGKPVFYEQYSIPYLLHSQPIIQEYFDRLKNAKSIVGDSQPNIEDVIFEELTRGHKFTAKSAETAQSDMTGKALVANLGASANTTSQKEILNIYRNLIADAKQVKELNQVVDLSNVGKSMWELKDKIETFEELKNPDGKFNKLFDNPLSLMGEIQDGEFVATTNQGKMVSTALEMGRKLFYDLYPYYDSYIEEKIHNIETSANYTGSKTALQEVIFQEIKKYVTSDPKNGVFTASPTLSREKIFFNKDGNQSLSRYMGDLRSKNSIIKDNVLLNALSHTVGINGKPDIIKFDNTEGANITEEDFHIAFKELLVSDVALPDRNGQPYSTRKMAQELVAYSHLSGGIISEVIEFHKYIPLEYYEDLVAINTTSTGKKQKTKSIRMMQRYDTKINKWGDSDLLRNFETQFFQNNPNYAPILTKKQKEQNATIDGDRMHLTIEEGATHKKFVAFKNPSENLKTEKWTLYRLMDNSGHYQKIEVVGDFGLSEYDTTKSVASTNVVKELSPAQKAKNNAFVPAPAKTNLSAVKRQPQEFTIEPTDNVLDVLKKISLDNTFENPGLSSVAKTMVDLFQDKVLTTKIQIINDANAPIGGSYTKDTLTINLAVPNVAEVFVHEFVHSVTADYINVHLNKDGSLKEGAPTDVKELNEVFKEYSRELLKKHPKESAIFAEKWATYKANKTLLPEQRTSVEFTDREKSVFYAALNLKEFLAIPLSNNKEFLEETGKMKYKSSATLSIGQKFAKVFQRLLNTIASKDNTVGKDLIESTLSFVAQRASKTKAIQQSISNSELQRLKALYGDEFETDHLPNNPQEKVGDVINRSIVEVENIFEAEGGTLEGGIVTFDKGSYKSNYDAMIGSVQGLKNYNRANFNVSYTNDWYETRRVGDKIQIRLSFPTNLQNDLIKNNGVLKKADVEQEYRDIEYSLTSETNEQSSQNAEHYLEDKKEFLKQIYRRINVLKQTYEKDASQLNQLKKLQLIRTQLHRDIEFLSTEDATNEIIPIFNRTFITLKRDLDIIKNDFLKGEPILENLLLGRKYLDDLSKIYSSTGEKRFSKEYFGNMEEGPMKKKFEDFQSEYSNVSELLSLAEDTYVTENITKEDATVEKEAKKLSLTARTMAKGLSTVEYLFQAIDGDKNSPIHNYARKVYDDGMSKRETAGMKRRLQARRIATEKRLKELGYGSKDTFFSKSVSSVSFELFFREDANGANRLISRYSNNWSELQRKTQKLLFAAKKNNVHTNKDQLNREAFNNLEKEQVKFVDVTKLAEINPDVDPAVAEQYKKELLSIIKGSSDNVNSNKSAEKEYNRLVSEQIDNSNNFEFDSESLLRELMNIEGVSLIEGETNDEILAKLSEGARERHANFIKSNSPVAFIESYNKNKTSEVDVPRRNNTTGETINQTSPSTLRYTSFIPTTSEYKSETFETKLEQDEVLYAAWEEFSETIAWNNRNRKYEDNTDASSFNDNQEYEDSLAHEYERATKNLMGIKGLSKYIGKDIVEGLQNAVSTSRFKEVKANMRISGEIKSIDEVVSQNMKDMLQILKASNINVNTKIEINKLSKDIVQNLEKRYGKELPTNGTYKQLVKKIARREVLLSQKVNLFDSLDSQLTMVETFKNKKEVEMELLFAKNMFLKLKGNEEQDTNAINQISNFINYNLYGVNNRANWNLKKRGNVGMVVTSLKDKQLSKSVQDSVELLNRIKNNVNEEDLTAAEKLKKVLEINKAIKDLTTFNESGGRVITTGSVFEALFLKLGLVSGLGFNLKSQFHNVMIGNTAGMQNDGLEYSFGHYYRAKSYCRKWKIAAREMSPKQKENHLLTNTLLNDLGIFQNSANEINNVREDNIGSDFQNYFNPLYLVGEVEKTIQRPQILAKLGDVMVHKYDDNGNILEGQSVPVFNINNLDNPHPAFELDSDGVLQMKKEFRQDAGNLNQKTWIDKTSQDKDFKQESVDKNGNIVAQSYAGLFGESGVLPSMIARMNGDYRSTSMPGIKNTSAGALAMMFKTWMTSYFMRRFHPEYGVYSNLAKNNRNVELGTAVIASRAAATMGNALLLNSPLALVVTAVGAFGGYHFYKSMKNDSIKGKAILKEINLLSGVIKASRTLGAAGLKTGQIALRTLNVAGSGEYITDARINRALGMKQGEQSNEDYAKDQARMSFLLTELAASINTLVLKGLAQAIYHMATDGDEEESKTALAIHYAVENLLARYLDEINLMTSFEELLSTALDGNSSSSNDKLEQIFDAVTMTLQGKGTIKEGDNKGDNRILNKLGNAAMPKGLQELLNGGVPTLGFGSSTEKDYEPDDQFNQLQHSDKKVYTDARAIQVEKAKEIKEEEIKKAHPGWNDEYVTKQVNKFIKSYYPSITEKHFDWKGEVNSYYKKRYKRYFK